MARPRRPLADKAYDAASLRARLKARRIRAVIPSTQSRKPPFRPDRKAYRRRNLIERLRGRLRNRPRLATRCDRLPRNHLAGTALASSASTGT
jgi:transposase